jgi:chaperonin GroES
MDQNARIISTHRRRVLTPHPCWQFGGPGWPGLIESLSFFTENRSIAMNLRPLHDRVIVKRIESETTTASGIVIPDNAAEKPDQGEVLAVGPGKRNDKGEVLALNVKVGDRVLFGKYSGQTVKVKGDELLVMKEDDLFAVVEK